MELTYIENLLKECPLTLVFTVVLLLLSIFFYKLKTRNSPPGPWGLPLVGYWPYLGDRSAHLQLQELMKKYGDIYSFRIAGQLYIHLGSIKSVREVHVTKSDCFTGRSVDFNLFTYFTKEGILGANGEQWKTLRKFFLQMFREYGLSSGKDISGSVYDCINNAMEHLRAANEEPLDIIPILVQHSTVVLRRLLFNDDLPELPELIENYASVTTIVTTKKLLLSGNFAKYVIVHFDPEYNHSMKCHKQMVANLTKIIKRHKDTLDEQSVRNVIDSYYKVRNERQRKNDPTAKYFTDTALVSSLIQIIGDGIVSVGFYISAYLNALLEYPEEQEKIFKELEDVLGPDRQPSLEDKSNLPYTNAFLLEVSRTAEFLPIFPTLECTKETTLGGYKIPKGAVSLVNFWAAHHDPNVYEEPDVFKPSRFLKEPGKEKAESPILFGVGKRACVGEMFTTLQTFIFVTSIVKNFRLELPEGASSKLQVGNEMKIIARPRMNK